MTHADFDKWCRSLGDTWAARDESAFARIFSENASYHWTPFQEPLIGREAIAGAVADAIQTQSDIRFRYDILSFAENLGIAHWSCSVKRTTTGENVTIDGMMVCRFDEQNLCTSFREWWHSTEQK